jgi:tetratricopeptide (TPR) repeat protein
LSELYATQNDLGKAWDYGYEALQTLKKTNSKIDKIASLNDLLGSISLQRQDFSGAKAYFDDAIKIRVAAIGDNDSSLAGSFFQLGVALDAQGEFTQSVMAYKRSLQIRNRNKMHDSLETAELFARLGCAHAKVKEYDDALTCLTNALNIRLDSSGEQTLDVADILR